MKRIKIFLLLFPSLFLFYQCKKDAKYLGTISFTSQDLQIIPYKVSDTITLIDSLGKAINFHVKTQKTSYGNWYRDNYGETGDYYEMESAEISADSSFDIWLIFSSPFSQPVKKYIDFEIFNIMSHPEITGNFEGQCSFDAGKINTGQGINLFVTYYDSLKIINKTFHSVYDLTYNGSPISASTERYSDVYLSVNQGICGIKTSKGRRWRLK